MSFCFLNQRMIIPYGRVFSGIIPMGRRYPTLLWYHSFKTKHSACLTTCSSPGCVCLTEGCCLAPEPRLCFIWGSGTRLLLEHIHCEIGPHSVIALHLTGGKWRELLRQLPLPLDYRFYCHLKVLLQPNPGWQSSRAGVQRRPQ